MLPSEDVTRSCPHCGGEIKLAAKICKHCRYSVEQRPDPLPVLSTAAASTPPLPHILANLRAFVATKPLVNTAGFDELLAARSTDDAAALLRQLATVGHVTQIQAEALVGEFHQRQMSLAHACIEVACAQSLVPVSHVEHAHTSYAPMAFTVAIHDHLVGIGLLTPAQADALRCQAPQAPRSGGTAWSPPSTAMRNLCVANGAALLVLVFALFSKTWWISGGFHAGLLDAEACNFGVCETHSYSEFESMLGEQSSADFRAFIGDAKLTFVVGFLAAGAFSTVMVFALRRRRTHPFAFIGKIASAIFIALAIKTLFSAREMSQRSEMSTGYGPVLAILGVVLGVVISGRLTRQVSRGQS